MKDKEIILSAFKTYSESVGYAPELLSDRNFIIELLKVNGMAIKEMEEYRNDKGIKYLNN